MDPHDYLKALRKRWLVIFLLGLLGAAAGYLYAARLPDVYQSTSAVFVSSLSTAVRVDRYTIVTNSI